MFTGLIFIFYSCCSLSIDLWHRISILDLSAGTLIIYWVKFLRCHPLMRKVSHWSNGWALEHMYRHDMSCFWHFVDAEFAGWRLECRGVESRCTDNRRYSLHTCCVCHNVKHKNPHFHRLHRCLILIALASWFGLYDHRCHFESYCCWIWHNYYRDIPDTNDVLSCLILSIYNDINFVSFILKISISLGIDSYPNSKHHSRVSLVCDEKHAWLLKTLEHFCT